MRGRSDVTAGTTGTRPEGHGPPVWIAPERAWLVSRHADATALLRAPDLEVVDVHAGIDRLGEKSGQSFSSLSNLLGATLFFRNPPFHGRARLFLARTLGALRGCFEEAALRPLAASLLAGALKRREAEAVAEVCLPMPLRATSMAMGVPDDTAATIVRSGRRILDAGQRGLPMRTLAGLEVEARAIETLIEENLRAAGRDGESGLSLMMRLNSDEFGFSERELVGLVFFLLWAAVDTTSALLASTLHLFATHPDQAALVRADAGLLPDAIEEVLRLSGSVKRTNCRTVGESFCLSGRNFPPRTMLIADIAAAQRDPKVYIEPDRFDVRRRGPPAMGFGLGAHTCLGAVIARREAQVLLAEILEAADFRLAGRPPQWQAHSVFRRLERLDLVFTRFRT